MQLNQIISIVQITDVRGLLWSKPSAEIPHSVKVCKVFVDLIIMIIIVDWVKLCDISSGKIYRKHFHNQFESLSPHCLPKDESMTN